MLIKRERWLFNIPYRLYTRIVIKFFFFKIDMRQTVLDHNNFFCNWGFVSKILKIVTQVEKNVLKTLCWFQKS